VGESRQLAHSKGSAAAILGWFEKEASINNWMVENKYLKYTKTPDKLTTYQAVYLGGSSTWIYD